MEPQFLWLINRLERAQAVVEAKLLEKQLQASLCPENDELERWNPAYSLNLISLKFPFASLCR
jgi:hypothetical protein